VRRVVVLVAAALVCACTQPRSARCKQVCERESECISTTSSQIQFDEKECVAACAVLEADQDNVAKVEHHAACVTAQASCAAVLECQ
jgi:hypothetical protein